MTERLVRNRDGVVGEPTGLGLRREPTFDTDAVVDWTCPSCSENGYDNPQTEAWKPTCTNPRCRVREFSVFQRGSSAGRDGDRDV